MNKFFSESEDTIKTQEYFCTLILREIDAGLEFFQKSKIACSKPLNSSKLISRKICAEGNSQISNVGKK